MTIIAVSQPHLPAVPGVKIRPILISLLLISLGGTLLGVWHRPITGDEFFFLSNIHRAANNQTLVLLQTAYTHLFVWLTYIRGDEIVQATAGRMVCVALWGISLGLLYRLGTRLADSKTALAGTVLFALFSYSVFTAGDFRIDGMLLPILLTIALLLTNPSFIRVAAAGALSGFAVGLSMKAVLWAPAFVAVLAIGLWGRSGKFRAVFAGGCGAVITLAVIMLSHYLLISDSGAPAITVVGVTTIGSQMLIESGPFPKLHYIVLSVLQNPMTWLFLILGCFFASMEIFKGSTPKTPLISLALTLPLLSLCFYTNSFPYTYLVLIPTVSLVAGKGFTSIVGDGQGLRGVVALVSLAAASLPLATFIWDNRFDRQQAQKEVLSEVHRLFQKPVPYIDSSGMVSSFPRTQLFPMSAWGFKGYQEAGTPIFRRYIEAERPPFLIVNSPALDIWNSEVAKRIDPLFVLLPEDSAILEDTYTHYWGKIYLAGRAWRDASAGEEFAFEILVPGAYTILSSGRVIVDGNEFEAGSHVSLSAGLHMLRTLSAENAVRLLWGKAIRVPTKEPNAEPLYPHFFGKRITTRCMLAMSSC